MQKNPDKRICKLSWYLFVCVIVEMKDKFDISEWLEIAICVIIRDRDQKHFFKYLMKKPFICRLLVYVYFYVSDLD